VLGVKILDFNAAKVPKTNRPQQGQSDATFDKERRIASALAIGMKIVNATAKRIGRNFKFWHFDANSGSGWNKEVDVAGSPVVFHKMADLHLTNIERKAFFCDIDEASLKKLKTIIDRDEQYAKTSFLIPGDNEEVLQVFARMVRRAENPQYALGCVLVDPNGYWYRNAKGIGAPVSSLLEFSQEFPRIDIVLNLNTRTYKLQKSQGHNVLPPQDVFSSLRKSCWLVGRTQYSGSEFILAVGRNTSTGSHAAIGMYKLESEEGRFILQMAEGHRQSTLAL
jgi:hypothetical protein